VHYPNWYVPFMTAPMVIAVISVLHVLVSHYAVGGGLFLAVETRYARRNRIPGYLAYLKDHAWFFILVTVVYGAVTGVGIWWSIGLASPLATQTLIHTFVFGWAMEYVFFLLEIASAFLFFYYWDRLDGRTHEILGFIYAGSAWISLVIITGITSFMLNTGNWPADRNFWTGFLNPQFIPQTLSRTGGSLLLASLYVYLHAAFRVKDPKLSKLIELRSTRPALLGSILVVLGGAGWYLTLPDSAKAALPAASMLNIMMALMFAITIAVFVMLYLGPYRNPGWLSPGFAILFFGLGVAALTVGEHVREAVRKPYIVYNVVMSNQILADEIPKFRAAGYLESGVWTKAEAARVAPEVMKAGRVDTNVFTQLSEAKRKKLGATLYQYHCGSCHAVDNGLSALGHLMRGWTPEMIGALVREPEKAHFFMPPWAGNDAEAAVLTEWLTGVAEPHPAGMYYGTEAAR